jgi:hypothetical protein
MLDSLLPISSHLSSDLQRMYDGGNYIPSPIFEPNVWDFWFDGAGQYSKRMIYLMKTKMGAEGVWERMKLIKHAEDKRTARRTAAAPAGAPADLPMFP